MTTDELRELIHRETPEYFKTRFGLDKKKKGIICPVCQKSGTGPTGTGPTSPRGAPHKFTCWTGCYTNADAIEIIGHGILKKNGYIDQLKATADYMGISYTLDDWKLMPPPEKPKQQPKEPEAKEAPEDLTNFFLQANANLKPDYLEARGISRETQDNFLIGFVS